MKKVVLTVEDRGIDYTPIIRYLNDNHVSAEWRPLKEQTAEELYRVVQDADAVIAGMENWNAEILKRTASRLKIIARYGIGYDSVDIITAKQLGIAVTNTPMVLSEAVAELALGLYIVLSRGISPSDARMHHGKWGSPVMGYNIEGKTVGIIGFGSIGQKFASLLMPFNCRILAYDPYLDEESALKLHVEKTDMERLIKESDCISLHLPSIPETKGLVNSSFLKKMKKTAYLINTSRGALINEIDLVKALVDGDISGAALDVYQSEPLPENSILYNAPNLIMTPHIGSATKESFLKAGMLAAENVLEALEGTSPRNRVN